MREIKFRGWVEKDKSLMGYREYTLEEVRLLEDQLPQSDNAKIIWEQYTGLKDKNGKEIYEGDIFRNTINGGTWRVNWDENDAAFWVDSGVAGCGLGEFNYDRGEREYGFIRKNCEVIGNIHENPELLGGGE